jgi:hypothetical protein
MTSFKLFASLVLTATAVSTLSAETRCPGNAASLPLRMVNRHQMIVSVSVNHTGPYNFLLDTGTQMTMVDRTLAATLKLTTSGTAEVASSGVSAAGTFAQVALIEAGSRSTANQKVLVFDLSNLRAAGLDIQGMLGEDFLEHFDMLIDNAHSVLCLDDAGTMQAHVKGQHVALLEPESGSGSADLAHSLIVSARLSDGMRPLRLKLDSGANMPFVYDPAGCMALGLYRGVALRGSGANGAQRAFTALPAQEVKIGSVSISNVSFITQAGSPKNVRAFDFDGLLTLGLFKRVLIDHADHFAVLEAW